MINYFIAENTERFNQSKQLILEYAESLGCSCSPCLENIEESVGKMARLYVRPEFREKAERSRFHAFRFDNGVTGVTLPRKA